MVMMLAAVLHSPTHPPGHIPQQVSNCWQLAGVNTQLEGQHARNKGGQVHRETLHVRTSK